MPRGKLGALPRDLGVRAPRYEDYLAKSVTKMPKAPPHVDDSVSVQLFMYCNGPDPGNPVASPDGIGDCTVAGMANVFGSTTAIAGKQQAIFDDQEIINIYSAVSGYDP